jgi:hypothetical protein
VLSNSVCYSERSEEAIRSQSAFHGKRTSDLIPRCGVDKLSLFVIASPPPEGVAIHALDCSPASGGAEGDQGFVAALLAMTGFESSREVGNIR